MGLTPQQTQVQCVNRTMDHGFDPTIDTSTGCKWDHGQQTEVHGVNGTIDLTLKQKKVQGANGSMSLTA